MTAGLETIDGFWLEASDIPEAVRARCGFAPSLFGPSPTPGHVRRYCATEPRIGCAGWGPTPGAAIGAAVRRLEVEIGPKR